MNHWREIPRKDEPDDGSGFSPVVEQYELAVGELRLNIFRRDQSSEYSAHAHVDGYCLSHGKSIADLDEAKLDVAMAFLPILRQATKDLIAVIAAMHEPVESK